MKQAAYLGILILSLLMTICTASAETLSSSGVKAVLSDLGYEPTVTNEVVTVDGLGSSKSSIKFIVSGDKSSMNMFASWGIPADKQTSIPTLELLKANDSSPFAFGVYGKEGELSLELEASYDASLVSKKMLRKVIDQLLESIDANEPLWNTDKWSAPKTTNAGPKDYKALQDEADAAWEKAPLAFQNVLFAQDRVPGYRDYTVRPNTEFKRGDAVHLYAEPVNFVWKSVKTGVFNINVSADLLVKTKDGNVVLDRKDFAKQSLDFMYKTKILDFSFNITTDESLPVADYIATITAHDLNGGKVATIDAPFSITK